MRFALALVVDPAVLILDEPTVGMDVEARREFWASVRGFAARGKTVIFATHYLDEADAYADRVILMSHGRVVADGPTSEVRAQVSRRTIRATPARRRPHRPVLAARGRRRGPAGSFIHVADAAEATVAAIEHGSRGAYNVVDDDPAPVAEWLPALAQELGAKRPMRVPRFIGRVFAGEAGAVMMTEIRGASNAKAKRELGWQPAHPSWRQGFSAA